MYQNWIFENTETETETEFGFTKITEITEFTETETEIQDYEKYR